jgi:nicotinamide mononucleotide transporter
MKAFEVEWLQIPATVLSLGYTWLAAHHKISAWPVALAASIIFLIISLQTDLIQDAILHIFYGLTAIWGWIHWHGKDKSNASRTISPKLLLLFMGLTALPALGSFALLFHLNVGNLPLADALTTWYSFLGTAWIIFKIRQAWLLFIAIDLLQAWIYFTLHLPILGFLYLGYTLLAGYAYWSWGTASKPKAKVHG